VVRVAPRPDPRWADRSALHRRAHGWLGAAGDRGGNLDARARGASQWRPGGADRAGGADVWPGSGRALALVNGPESEYVWGRQVTAADRAAPRHWPDRQAGRRPVLADRSAQRDGRPGGRRAGELAAGPPRRDQPDPPGRDGPALGRTGRAALP